MKTIKMAFRESGEFITKITREKCCLKGEMKDAVQLLREIIIPANPDPDDLHPADPYIYEILNGCAELTGIISNDPEQSTAEFKYIPGAENKCDIADAMAKFKNRAEHAEEQLRITTNRYLFILDHLSEFMTQDELYDLQKSYQDEYSEEDPAGLQLVDEKTMSGSDRFYGDLIHAFNQNSEQSELSPIRDISAIIQNPSKAVNEFIQHMHEESDDDEYGWLEPDGTYHPVPWGEHSKWATEYLEAHYPMDKFPDLYCQDPKAKPSVFIYAGDVLMYRLNWVLIDSPQQSYGIHRCNPERSMTKKQKEFLYDYYRKHKNYRAADALYADEDD